MDERVKTIEREHRASTRRDVIDELRRHNKDGTPVKLYGHKAFWDLVRLRQIEPGATYVRAMYSGVIDTVFEVKADFRLVILNPFRDMTPKDPTLALSLDECPDGWEIHSLNLASKIA